MKKLSFTNQFRVGMAAILLLFGIGFSLLVYSSLKTMVDDAIYKETEIFVTTVESTRTYVKDVTRPRITRMLPPGGFIPEVMSTSYVGREIMNRVRQQFPHFHYKRAARNPMNPVNQADAFELQMLNWFDSHREAEQWSGVIRKGNTSYFARMKAIYAEEECLACHGHPKDAPAEMRALYGTGGGYGYYLGEVVAADTVYIPVDVAFVRIKEKAFWVFIIGTGSLFVLFGMFYLLFNRTIVSHLRGLMGTFQDISGKPIGNTPTAQAAARGELEQVQAALESAALSVKQAHDELKISESKYRQLFETSLDAIFICDTQRRLVDINRAGIKLFGFQDRAEALRIPAFDWLFREAGDAELLWKTIQTSGFVNEFETSMVGGAGNRRHVIITAHQRASERGQPEGLEGNIRDVTEKRRLEKYLSQTEKLASIGQLAAGVAHEINNPLGVIQCYAGLIKKSAEPSSQILEDVKIIEKHTLNCKSVVEALLSFARVSEPRMEQADIHACIDDVLSVLDRHMQKHSITITRQYGSGLPLLTIDVQKMKQVFMNLLLNAQQSIGHQGNIDIETQCDMSTRVVYVRISDSGTGISVRNQERIFEPFFTTKSESNGTGLGLAVTYGIVKQHDGDITVDSSPGEGATFTVALPVVEHMQ